MKMDIIWAVICLSCMIIGIIIKIIQILNEN